MRTFFISNKIKTKLTNELHLKQGLLPPEWPE